MSPQYGLIALDKTTRAHLVRAIRFYQQRLRVDGLYRLPGDLKSLLEALSEDSDGQDGTDLAPVEVVGDDGRVMYSLDQVAHRLSVSTKTVQRLIASGDLHAVRIGRLVRIHRDDLEEYATRLRKDAG